MPEWMDWGHLFFDRSPTPELVADIASAGAFVIPTLVTLSTAFGNSAATLAADERVSVRLSKQWLDSLSRSMNVYPQGKLADAYATVRALHAAPQAAHEAVSGEDGDRRRQQHQIVIEAVRRRQHTSRCASAAALQAKAARLRHSQASVAATAKVTAPCRT